MNCKVLILWAGTRTNKFGNLPALWAGLLPGKEYVYFILRPFTPPTMRGLRAYGMRSRSMAPRIERNFFEKRENVCITV